MYWPGLRCIGGDVTARRHRAGPSPHSVVIAAIMMGDPVSYILYRLRAKSSSKKGSGLFIRNFKNIIVSVIS